MSLLWRRTNRWLTWFHRWASVVLCLLIAVWFASGAVLHFIGFPSLSLEEERAQSEVIDAAQLKIDPKAALEQVPLLQELRLMSVATRPVYLAKAHASWVRIAADTGDLLPTFTPAIAQQVAESFGHAHALQVSGALDYDQWIVHQHFDLYRPLYRVSLDDTDRTDLYVSSRTGEVVQRTRFRERVWNWPGAVIHWLYFTPLRKSYWAWNQTVWWVSLFALLSSVAGIWLGVWRTLSNRAAGRRGLTSYRGWMRWHHLIGLFASVIVLGWILSGWLSMDHGRLFSFAEANPTQVERLRSASFNTITGSASLAALAEMLPATTIDFNAIDGQPFLTAYGPGWERPRVRLLSNADTEVQRALPESLIESAARAVWPSAAAAPRSDSHDMLYRRAESTGSNAKALVAGSTRIYIDEFSGRILAVLDVSRRNYAWIYYALHTLQFPGLIDHPLMRTTVVLLLLAAGFAFSITGIVLSVVRLRREFA